MFVFLILLLELITFMSMHQLLSLEKPCRITSATQSFKLVVSRGPI